jgi:heme-degrading monooxygenase HmoA
MVLEVAILNVIPGREAEFVAAFRTASRILSSIGGYLSHQLQRCVENQSQYILLVHWETLEDHTKGFRESPGYDEWRRLLHHFYDPFPTVEDYELVHENRVGPVGGESS